MSTTSTFSASDSIAQFVATELAMRQAVVESAFGRYLVAHLGRSLTHAKTVDRFRSAFATTAAASLQVQCKHDADGQPILTQL